MICKEKQKHENPYVSVIIPVYNAEKSIEKCIDSILSQTYPYLEAVVVNDGSSDRTADVINRKYGNEERVKYYFQENQGVSAARNQGIKKSVGKYLLFVDGDDYLQSSYIEKLVLCAEKNQSELVVSGYTKVDEAGNVISLLKPKDYARFYNEAVIYCISAVCSRLYRRSFWIGSKMEFVHEDDARGEDVPIALQANYMARNISTVYDGGYYYVQHGASAMEGLYGFQKYHFPYKTMEELLRRMADIQGENSKEFFIYGVYKFFAQFAFQLVRGAGKKEIVKLEKYIYKIYNEFPSLRISFKIWYRMLKCSFTFLQKMAVLVLILGIKSKTLGGLMIICSRAGRRKC